MGTGRRLAGGTVRFLLCCALAGSLTIPQAIAFMSAESRTAPASSSVTKPAFTVKGNVKGLFPGSKKPLALKLRNRSRYPIKVKLLTIRVAKPQVPGCKRSWLKVRKLVRTRIKLKRNRRASVTIGVKLAKEATDKCQRARWNLKYRGRAVRA